MLCLLDFAVFVVDTSRFLFVFDMPLYCSGELITVGHHKYSSFHSYFIQNRERLRRQSEFPVQFGHVGGLCKTFAARRSDPAYILFDIER